jgi:hypothetical protein
MLASVFIVGLVKSGSTLLNRIMRPLTEAAGLTYRSPPDEIFRRGLKLKEQTIEFEPFGHAYGGFRELPWPLPDFGADRTVLLVRDPRDALTSLYFSMAFSHVPPGAADGSKLLQAFEARRARALASDIDAFVLREADGHARLIKRALANTPRHRLYRYEEIIFDKRAWAADMVDYLGLQAPPRLISAVAARNDLVPAQDAPLQHVRHVTPGDHRDKLRPETIAALDARFAHLMKRLGYPIETASHR